MINIYAIYDKKSSSYDRPTFAITDGVMIRDFRVFLRSKSMLSDYPEDYELYSIGLFNEETGVITAYDVPQFVISFIDIIKMDTEVSTDVDQVSEESRDA